MKTDKILIVGSGYTSSLSAGAKSTIEGLNNINVEFISPERANGIVQLKEITMPIMPLLDIAPVFHEPITRRQRRELERKNKKK